MKATLARSKKTILLLVAWLSVAQAASAAVVITENDNATDIIGLNVGGISLNVSFRLGDFFEFEEVRGFRYLNDEFGALQLVDAINTALSGIATTVGSPLSECSGSLSCTSTRYFVPTEDRDIWFNAAEGISSVQGFLNDGIAYSVIPNNYIFALVEPAATPVPLPSTFYCFAANGILFSVIQRYKRLSQSA